MNKKQKNVLVGVIILIVAMLVYPPFQYTGENGVITNMGYDWIYDPPRYLGRYNARATINVSVLLVQWLGVFLVGGLGFYLTRNPAGPGQTQITATPHANENKGEDSSSHAQSTSNQASSVDVALVGGPVGVGGWLLLLIAGLMIFGPLLGAGRLYGEIMMLERTYPNLSSVSEWSTYKSTVGWVFLGSAAISFLGGLRLSREKDWSAVENAIAALWISGPGASVALGVLVPFIIFGKASLPDADIVPGLLGSVIASSVWTAYLLKSRRVRNTFQKTAVNEGAVLNDREPQHSQASVREPSGTAMPKRSIFDTIVGLFGLGFLLIIAIGFFSPSQQTPPQLQATTKSQAQTSAGTPPNNQTASRPRPLSTSSPLTTSAPLKQQKSAQPAKTPQPSSSMTGSASVGDGLQVCDYTDANGQTRQTSTSTSWSCDEMRAAMRNNLRNRKARAN